MNDKSLRIIYIVIIFLNIILNLQNCVLFREKVKIKPIPFDYQAIGKNYFNPYNDKPFPLTIQRGNNLYNSVSKDGRYLFYATDKDGNFDIWFRDLSSSVVVPVTNHPARDYKPAISPDGTKLVFVSERFDPEGDILLLKMDPEKWVKEFLKGERYINQKFQVLTNPYWKDSSFQQRVIDTDPAWFPDNENIVFSSDRFTPGIQNLVLLNTRNNQMKLLTYDGGASPYVSDCGNFIYYISYQDSELGEIYSYEMESGKINRLTNNQYIEFSPSVSHDKKFLFYTIIPKDTNGNGILDERDKSYIVRKELSTGKQKFLSSGDISIFDTKYSNFNGGSILFSAALFNAINVYFIPYTGSIPKQSDIIEQFNYALSYEKTSSQDNFFLALDSVELFFDQDPLFKIYKYRILAKKVSYLKERKKNNQADEFYNQILRDSKTNLLASSYGIYLSDLPNQKKIQRLLDIVKLNSSQLENSDMELTNQENPTILHLVYDLELKQKNIPSAIETLKRIQSEYPRYHLIREIKNALTDYEFHSNSVEIPEFFKSSLLEYEKMVTNQETISHSLKLEIHYILTELQKKITENKTPDEALVHIENILGATSFPNESKVAKSFMEYLKAKVLRDKKEIRESNQLLERIIPIPENLELYPLNQKSIFETPYFIQLYMNPSYSYMHYLRFQNSKDLGDNQNALRHLQIFMEFYDPILSPELDGKELTYLFLYWENKAIEFERLGNLREAAFHYYFNNLGMSLAKSRNLTDKEFYSNYAVYYQRKMIDTIFAHGSSLRAKEEANLLKRLNILGEENLNVLGNLSLLFSYLQKLPFLDALKFLGDFRDLRTKDAIHEDALLLANLYFSYHLERNRPYLNLAVSYGHAYYLINRAVINEKYLYERNNMTEAKKRQILEYFKKAEYELKWILYTDPTFPDAYQLLGWLYQYIDIMKSKRLGPKEPTEEERYSAIYNLYFPEKNFEENVELYTQILEFLGENYPNKKILSDINVNLGNNYFLLTNYLKANEASVKVDEYSKYILSKSQFDNYKQEALFRYNYGRSSLYRGNYEKAIIEFEKAIQLYEKNEYRRIDSIEKISNENQELEETKGKIAILNALIGLSYMELGEFDKSILYIQKSISYNHSNRTMDSLNLWNALAISYQKTGRFIDSFSTTNTAWKDFEEKYSKSSSWRIAIQDSLWNLLLPDNIRVLGEGRFPGELPLVFKGLLIQSIEINNYIEKRDFKKALELLELREKFIQKHKLKKWVMGNLVSLKSIALRGQIYYDSENYIDAYQSYQKYTKEASKYGNWNWEKEGISHTSYSIFAHVENKILNNSKQKKELILTSIKYLNDNFNDLNQIQKNYLSKCILDLDDFQCKIRFKRDFHRFDILVGLNHFYLGELKSILNLNLESYYHYLQAVEYLENLSYLDKNHYFLKEDPVPTRERIRSLLNLSKIYLKLNNEEKSRECIKKASEIAYEFQLTPEIFYSKLFNLDLDLAKTKSFPVKWNLKPQKSIQELDTIYNSSEQLQLSIPAHIHEEYRKKVNMLLLISNQMWDIPIREDMYTYEKMRKEIFQSDLEFKNLELNDRLKEYYQLIRNISKEERGISNQAIRREKLRDRLNKLQVLKKEKLKLEENIQAKYPQYSFLLFKNYYEASMNSSIPYYRCYLEGNSYYLYYQDLNIKKIHNLSQEELLSFLNENINSKRRFWNPGNCNILPPNKNETIKWFIVFLDRDVNLKRHNELLLGKFRLVVSSPSNDNKTKDKQLIRRYENENLNYELIGTDYLYIENPRLDESYPAFTYKGLGSINLRELVSNPSVISTIILENSHQLNNIQSLIDIYLYANITNPRIIVLAPNLNENQRVNFNVLNAPQDYYLFGYVPESLSNNKNYIQLINEGIENERKMNWEQAYNNYFMAIYNSPENEKQNLFKYKVYLERLKRKLYNSTDPDYFIKPLLNEYQDQRSQLDIIYSIFLIDCFSDRTLKKSRKICEKYYDEFEKLFSNSKNFPLTRMFYNLYKGNTKLLKDSTIYPMKSDLFDTFVLNSMLLDLFIDNFMFEEAFINANGLNKIAKSTQEKEWIQNKNYEILYHKAFLIGDEEFSYQPIIQELAYAHGFNRDWNKFLQRISSRKFRKLGESDQIFEEYRAKLFLKWKDWNFGQEFESSVLIPEELYEGGSVLSRLSQLNRSLLFRLLSDSSKHQIFQETDQLMEMLINQEIEEGFYNRAYAFLLYYSDDLIRNGRVQLARKNIEKFENSYNATLNQHNLLESQYSYLMLKLSYLTNDIVFTQNNFKKLKNEDKIIANLIKELEEEEPSSYARILNKFKNQFDTPFKPFTQKFRNKLLDLLFLMKHFGIQNNKAEGFLDALYFEQIINSIHERTFGRRLFFSDLPTFNSIYQNLVNQIPTNQELSIIHDFRKSTYLIQVSDGKVKGRELFKENNEIKFLLRNYYRYLKLYGDDSRTREILDDRYRTAMRLNPDRIHYLYLTDYHWKVPLQQRKDITILHVQNLDTLIKQKRIPLQAWRWKEAKILSKNETNFSEGWYKNLKNLENWELNSLNSSRGMDIIISKEDLRVNENGWVIFGDTPIAFIYTKKSKRNFHWITTSNFLDESNFLSRDLNNSYYYLSFIHEGLGIISINDQADFHGAVFLKTFLSRKNIFESGLDRFVEARAKVRDVYPFDKYWGGFRIYTTAFVIP